MGRPSKFTDKIAAEICERIGNGEPLAQICRDEGMPPLRTVYGWQAEREDFSASIARAREAGFDQIALDAMNIADETSRDTVREDGKERPNTEWITRSRLRVETRLKLLAKWDPKRYGDRQLIGNDPDNPMPGGFVVNLHKATDA
jgi:hypothetical protein